MVTVKTTSQIPLIKAENLYTKKLFTITYPTKVETISNLPHLSNHVVVCKGYSNCSVCVCVCL